MEGVEVSENSAAQQKIQAAEKTEVTNGQKKIKLMMAVEGCQQSVVCLRKAEREPSMATPKDVGIINPHKESRSKYFDFQWCIY